MGREKMRFSVLTEKGHAEVRERKLPEIGTHQVLVKQLACEYLYNRLWSVAWIAGTSGVSNGRWP